MENYTDAVENRYPKFSTVMTSENFVDAVNGVKGVMEAVMKLNIEKALWVEKGGATTERKLKIKQLEETVKNLKWLADVQ